MGLALWAAGFVLLYLLFRDRGYTTGFSWESRPDGVESSTGFVVNANASPHEVGLAIQLERGLAFDARPETRFDRWLYRRLDTRDIAVGVDVDARLHYVSWSPSLDVRLRTDATLRNHLRRIAAGPDIGGYRIVEIRCRDGRLEALFRTGGLRRGNHAQLARAIAPRLVALRDALPPEPAYHAPPIDRRRMPGDGFRAVVLALSTNAVLQFGRIAFTPASVVVEQLAWLCIGLLGGGVVLVVTVALAARAYRGTPHLTTVLGPLLPTLLAGCLFAGPTLVRDVNIALDFTAPRDVVVWADPGRRSTKLRVHGYPGAFLVVGRRPGGIYRASLRHGALGIAWLDLGG